MNRSRMASFAIKNGRFAAVRGYDSLVTDKLLLLHTSHREVNKTEALIILVHNTLTLPMPARRPRPVARHLP